MTVTGLFHLNFRRKLGRMQEGERERERGRAMSATDLTTSFVWVIKIAQLAGVDFRTGHAYIQTSHTHTYIHIQGTITESSVRHAAFWAQAKLEQMKPILIYSRLA